MSYSSGRRSAVFSAVVSCLTALGGCSSSDAPDDNGREAIASVAEPLAPTGPFLVLNSAFNSVDFSFQNLNTVSAGKVVLIRNDGTSALSISAVTLTGTNPGDFAIGTATNCVGAQLAAGASCSIETRFAPKALGKRTARITIKSNASGSTHKIPVAGTGSAPAVSAPRTVDHASRAEGVAGTGSASAVSAPTAGPIDPRHGFPAWYQDKNGLKLEPCVENATFCLTTMADPTQPPLVGDTASNWIDEAFYWSAEATINRASGGKVLLVLALEAVFASDVVAVGDQITFGRVRIRVDNLTPGATYTVTHPFGTKTLVADSKGAIDTTTDTGCAAAGCDFRAALASPLTTFLRWDPAVAPAAPAGFLGNGAVPHKITGSPTGNNIFKVTGPNVGGAGINTIQTDQFTLAGKLLP